MSRKEQFMAAGLVCASVGLFYLAIDFWLCGSGAGCKVPSQVARALSIESTADTPDGWAGPGKENYQVTDPAETFRWRSTTPETTGDSFNNGDGDDDGGN